MITFRNVSKWYGSFQVLKNCSTHVGKGQVVVVCGPSGSGKSTLMLLLFRFLELDAGTIFIDRLDISKLKLSELRQTIAILPQEPILFGGSVRENLDPFEEHLVRTHYDKSQHASAAILCHCLTMTP